VAQVEEDSGYDDSSAELDEPDLTEITRQRAEQDSSSILQDSDRRILVQRVKTKADSASDEAPPESETAVAPDVENRFFTLELSARIGGTSIPAQDPQTWARLGYCLDQESPQRFFLVYGTARCPRSRSSARTASPSRAEGLATCREARRQSQAPDLPDARGRHVAGGWQHHVLQPEAR
jgi:hypothetical protein